MFTLITENHLNNTTKMNEDQSIDIIISISLKNRNDIQLVLQHGPFSSEILNRLLRISPLLTVYSKVWQMWLS